MPEDKATEDKIQDGELPNPPKPFDRKVTVTKVWRAFMQALSYLLSCLESSETGYW